MQAHARISRRRNQRGSVIVVVLITLMLASLMLVKFMESSEVELVLATRKADNNRLKDDAFAALETALAVMAEIRTIDDGKLNSPAQGWGDPYAYAGESPREGLSVSFEFQDESGRVSLPTLKFDDLVLLAQALGLGESDARRFSDGLFTWMHADHISQDIESDATRYERAAIPHKPPQRSLRSWDELRAVAVANTYVYDEDGALTPFGTALRENVSLYRYQDANINAITPGWLMMRKWDEFQLASLEGYKSGKAPRAPGAPPWFREVDEVGKAVGAKVDTTGLDAEAKLVRILITLKEGAATLRLNALVASGSKVALPAAVAADANTGDTTKPPASAAPEAAPAPGSGNAAGADEKLKYPFYLLELSFDSGPASVAPAEPDPDSDPEAASEKTPKTSKSPSS
jgi:general secretion pathway protein K